MFEYVRLLFAALLLIPATLTADETAPTRSISVSGTVVAKAAPDQVVWRIELTDFDKDMRRGKKSNDEKIKAVLALRDDLDLGNDQIETGQLSINREYERTERGQRGAFKHYRISRSVTIRQNDLKRFDEFLDKLVASSEMEISFGFESSKIHEIRAETRLKALAAARKKAADMAAVVGAELGRVLTIDEHANRPYTSPMSNSSFGVRSPSVDAGTDRFVPGAISVQISVYATFELE